MYDNRVGSEYRARGDYVVGRYMNGPNVGWFNDESKLRSIADDWEETSKIGHEDMAVSQMGIDSNTTVAGKKNFLDSVVLDYYIYNEFNYCENYLQYIATNPPMAANGIYNDKPPNSIKIKDNIYYQKVINLLNAKGNILRNIQATDSGRPIDDNISRITTNLTNSTDTLTFLKNNYGSEFEETPSGTDRP